MPDAVEERVAEALAARGETLAVAESCTGGLVSSLVTDVAGASDRFVEGVVAYQPEVKVRALGVDPGTIEAHGTVSAPVVEEMATGMLERAGTDRALATTGYAGPEGGTEETPVGTLFVGVASSPADAVSRRHRIEGARRLAKEAMAHQALADLLDLLG